MAKLYAYWITVNYREAYGIHASNGILFNHESPMRGETFVTRKITRAVAAIELGCRTASIWAIWMPSATGAMPAIMSRACGASCSRTDPDDYVLATGESHSVREFVELAFQCVGRDIVWSGEGDEEVGRDRKSGDILVEVDARYYRPTEVAALRGDPRKARERLGWHHKTSFTELVAEMVNADMDLLKTEPLARRAYGQRE